MYSFPALPSPIKKDWNHVQGLHPQVLQMCRVSASDETQGTWVAVMHDLSEAAKARGLTGEPPHLPIQSLHALKKEQ